MIRLKQIELRDAVKRHPRYRQHQKIMGLLSKAVDLREETLRSFVRASGDDIRADQFCEAHIEMRKLQQQLQFSRVLIAADYGVSPDNAWQLFSLPYPKS
jgi:hypothetical protein